MHHVTSDVQRSAPLSASRTPTSCRRVERDWPTHRARSDCWTLRWLVRAPDAGRPLLEGRLLVPPVHLPEAPARCCASRPLSTPPRWPPRSGRSARPARLTCSADARSVLRPHLEEEGHLMPDHLMYVPTDPSSIAAADFLARYREPTVSAYRNDLRCRWAWCAQHELQPLQAQRAHLELHLRDLQDKGSAPATISRPPVDRRRVVPLRRQRRSRGQEPDAIGQPTQRAVGGTTPNGAAPTGVRCGPDRRGPARRHRPRPRRTADPPGGDAPTFLVFKRRWSTGAGVRDGLRR